ncbi:MAG: hypothetical protein EXX96DRAFT_556663 [Benjaminiella poitrasii]|nr:MAG: hypothetical protein EXX96DRAFT_556663 [Benjaminiella poitrasii]
MIQEKNRVIIQILLLFIIQWLSISVVILNALALNETKNINQGLIIAAKSGPQEFVLLILGTISLFAASLLLCPYLQMTLRFLENRSPVSLLSRRFLMLEIALSITIIAVWTISSVIILIQFNESSSCRKANISVLSTQIYFDKFGSSNAVISPKACYLANSMIIVGKQIHQDTLYNTLYLSLFLSLHLAFITNFTWLVTLSSSICTLSNVKKHSLSGIFIMQEPIQNNNKSQFSKKDSIVIEIHSTKNNVISIENEKRLKEETTRKTTKRVTAYLEHQRSINDHVFLQGKTLLDTPKPIMAAKNKDFDFIYFEPVNLNLNLSQSTYNNNMS